MEKELIFKKLEKFHDKNYKLILLVPMTILLFSLVYLGVFYVQTGDFVHKDISLTGGTSVTIYESIDSEKLKMDLSDKFEEINTRNVYDLLTREKKAIIIETKSEENIKEILEDYLGYELNEKNSSFEFTGAVLSESFYKQLLLAIL